MSAMPDPPPDVLVTALPPATDYITYLTLLEYQLTPENLPTLNTLLLADDGTLAEEIGWDLLKLVLPMLSEVPNEATRCLEIIAHRGNPREVVVKIAEELESLGREEDRVDHGSDKSDDEDELPTFAGEAKRIHLGRMTLDGMPLVPIQDTGTSFGKQRAPAHEDSDYPASVLKLTTLLNMLSILHPRIKTQYPSRFLATTLPAALRAYRHMPITTYTTSSFFTFLSKLSGKQRPALPPRTSTTSSKTEPTKTESTKTESTKTESTPLPDHEAAGDTISSNTPSINEKEIVQRLLQAVMLEVLDEFTLSIQSSEVPCMSWTLRLREVLEPKMVVPGRSTENQKWQSVDDLLRRDALMAQFLRLANDLSLDLEMTFQELMDDINGGGNVRPSEDSVHTDVESPSEFPRSPSEIPFPHTGILLLYTASRFLQHTQHTQSNESSTSKIPSTFPTLSLLYLILRSQASQDNSTLPLAVADAILALLYLSCTKQPAESVAAPTFTRLVADLVSFSASSQDPSLRDSAHTVATKIYHTYPIAEQRVRTAREIISIHADRPAQGLGMESAMVTAVVVDWVKDEFLAFLRQESPSSIGTTDGNAEHVGLDPTILKTDAGFQALLFPDLEPLANQTLDDEIETMWVQTQLPAFVARVNLFCVLCGRSELRLTRADDMVEQLAGVMKRLQQQEKEGEQVHIWAWALEDALGRAREATAGQGEDQGEGQGEGSGTAR
jgi:Uncharacterised protein family, YAP/Alf4/glomulin